MGILVHGKQDKETRQQGRGLGGWGGGGGCYRDV